MTGSYRETRSLQSKMPSGQRMSASGLRTNSQHALSWSAPCWDSRSRQNFPAKPQPTHK